MRKTIFRGLNKKGKWIYGDLVNCVGIKHMPRQNTKTWIVTSAFGNGGWFNIRGRECVLPDTVGQFTDLKDKNGVDIYEGDIISQIAEFNDTQYFDGGFESSEHCEFEYLGVVAITASKGVVINKAKRKDLIACDGAFIKTWTTSVRGCRASIIGNIHQNPELIEV